MNIRVQGNGSVDDLTIVRSRMEDRIYAQVNRALDDRLRHNENNYNWHRKRYGLEKTAIEALWNREFDQHALIYSMLQSRDSSDCDIVSLHRAQLDSDFIMLLRGVGDIDGISWLEWDQLQTRRKWDRKLRLVVLANRTIDYMLTDIRVKRHRDEHNLADERSRDLLVYMRANRFFFT